MKKLLCLLKQDEKNYRQYYVKESEIGILYQIVEDKMNNKSDKIIVIKKNNISFKLFINPRYL